LMTLFFLRHFKLVFKKLPLNTQAGFDLTTQSALKMISF
jgi:hypothetical protein